MTFTSVKLFKRYLTEEEEKKATEMESKIGSYDMH